LFALVLHISHQKYKKKEKWPLLDFSATTTHFLVYKKIYSHTFTDFYDKSKKVFLHKVSEISFLAEQLLAVLPLRHFTLYSLLTEKCSKYHE